MLNASRAFRREMADGTAKYIPSITVTLLNGTTLNLTSSNLWQGSLKIEDAVSSESDFQVGAAIVNKASFSINNIYEDYGEYDFNGATVIIYIGQRFIENGQTRLENLRKGTYIVNEATYDSSLITLECLDYMVKFDKAYTTTNITYPESLGVIVRKACEACGVTLNTFTFPHNDFVVAKPEEADKCTFREVIAWCAQIAGCYARCDNQGRLELKWFNQSDLEGVQDWIDGGNLTDYTRPDGVFDGGSFTPWTEGDGIDGGSFNDYPGVHFINRVFSHNVSTDDVVITGVRISVKKETTQEGEDPILTVQTGTNGYVIEIVNNAFITTDNINTILTWLSTQLIGLKFRKANVSHLSTPTMEAGDVAILWDRKLNFYPILISKTSFSLGGQQNTISSAQTPVKNSGVRYSVETRNYVEMRQAIQKEKSERVAQYEALEEGLNDKEGLYSSAETTQSGSIFYLHDKPLLADSSTVWKMTKSAWGVTTNYNGENTVWNAGMTVDGNTIVNILTATGINADWIRSGAIQIGKTVNGQYQETFYASADTGAVRIVCDSFSLTNGDTISSIASSAVTTYDGTLTDTELLARITNNGNRPGIFLSNGELYINATYISTGTLQDPNGNTTFDLSTGYLSMGRGSITIGQNFSVTDTGIMACQGAYIYGVVHSKSTVDIGFGLQEVELIDGIIRGYSNNTLCGVLDLSYNLVNSDTFVSLRSMTGDIVFEPASNHVVKVNGADFTTFSGNRYGNITCGSISVNGSLTGTGQISVTGNITGNDIEGRYIISNRQLKAKDTIHCTGACTVTDYVSVGTYLTVSGNITYGGSISQSSDMRLKENILTYSGNATELLMRLNPVSFDWISTGVHKEAGFIAQEVQVVIPEIVTENHDGYLGIDYVALVPYLVKAIQEQKDEIDKLKQLLEMRNV